jgi:hypothetical protein
MVKRLYQVKEAKQTKQTVFSWDMDVSGEPAQEIDAFTLLTADIEDHEICCTCLDMGKEIQAAYELDTFMYCSEHYPLTLN